ncbi:hypothetical protein FOZ63_021198, partial [Perkinsus olseni]
AHGGGRRCLWPGCLKAARPGDPQMCIKHGGGKRCKLEGCTRQVHRGDHCRLHGISVAAGTRVTSPLGRQVLDEASASTISVVAASTFFADVFPAASARVLESAPGWFNIFEHFPGDRVITAQPTEPSSSENLVDIVEI